MFHLKKFFYICKKTNKLNDNHKIKEIESKDDIKISFSEFSLYSECAHKHLVFKHLKLAEREPSIHLFFGNAIHSSIELGEKNNLSKEEKINNFVNVFTKDMVENMSNSEQIKELKNFIEQGKNILNSLDCNSIMGDFKIIDVEYPLYETIYKSFKFKGYIDVIAYSQSLDMYLILDWKTSGEEWDVDKKKNDYIFLCQMRFYKYFWARKNNISLDKVMCKYVVLNRLKDKKKPNGDFGKIQIVDIDSTEEEIFESLNKIGEVLKKIYVEKVFPKAKFLKNEMSSCFFCELKGGNHLCDKDYNQYVKLIIENKK